MTIQGTVEGLVWFDLVDDDGRVTGTILLSPSGIESVVPDGMQHGWHFGHHPDHRHGSLITTRTGARHHVSQDVATIQTAWVNSIAVGRV